MAYESFKKIYKKLDFYDKGQNKVYLYKDLFNKEIVVGKTLELDNLKNLK